MKRKCSGGMRLLRLKGLEWYADISKINLFLSEYFLMVMRIGFYGRLGMERTPMPTFTSYYSNWETVSSSVNGE